MTAKKTVEKVAKPRVVKTVTKAAPAAKKPVVKEPAAPTKAPKGVKKAAPRKEKALVASTGEAAFKKIEQEAYFIAEKDGFRRDPLAYWSEAEIKLGMRKG